MRKPAVDLKEPECPAHNICDLVGVFGEPCQAYPLPAKSVAKIRPEMRRLALIQTGVEQMLYCHQATILLLDKICTHLGIDLESNTQSKPENP